MVEQLRSDSCFPVGLVEPKCPIMRSKWCVCTWVPLRPTPKNALIRGSFEPQGWIKHFIWRFESNPDRAKPSTRCSGASRSSVRRKV